MTETSGADPVVELVSRGRGTLAFLKMAAIELRHIAEREPDVAAELRHVAQQLDAEAEALLHALPDDRDRSVPTDQAAG